MNKLEYYYGKYKRAKLPKSKLFWLRCIYDLELYSKSPQARVTLRKIKLLEKELLNLKKNPLTKSEKEEIKGMANTQFGISQRYQDIDPVRSSFYKGRSVGMGKIARSYNPLKKFCCSRCGRCCPKSLLPHSKFTERFAWLRKHYRKYHPTIFKRWYKNPNGSFYGICPFCGAKISTGTGGMIVKCPRCGRKLPPRKFLKKKNPLIEGAVTGLGFGAGLFLGKSAVEGMIKGKNPNPLNKSIYRIDNDLSITTNLECISKLIGELPSGIFMADILLLGGGGKYGRTIRGMKGVRVYGYITIRTPYRKLKTRDIKISKRILADKFGNLDISAIKRNILKLKEELGVKNPRSKLRGGKMRNPGGYTICPHCGKKGWYRTGKAYPAFRCRYCGKTEKVLRSKKNPEGRPRRSGLRDPRAKCPYCGKSMVSRPKWSSRIDYWCPHCRKGFIYKE